MTREAQLHIYLRDLVKKVCKESQIPFEALIKEGFHEPSFPKSIVDKTVDELDMEEMKGFLNYILRTVVPKKERNIN